MPEPLSAADIAEGRRLMQGASEGPWETYVSRTDVLPGRETREIVRRNGDLHPWNVLKVGNACCWPPTGSDAELIVWARNHLPALLDAAEKVRALEAQIDRVREVHEPIDAMNMRYPGGRLTSVCTGCGTDNGNWQMYPCPTIRALDAARGGAR